ncbi:peroxiredoxin [soil metagenome]
MKRTIGRSLAVLGMAVAVAGIAVAAEELKVGDKAPEFSLKGSDGETHTLSDYKGEKAVVIAWFPKAFTGGCTKECKAFKEQGNQLKDLEVAYFTASTDDAETNTKFAQSLDLDYPILSDPTGEVARAYGVMMPDRGLARRVTFYIDKEGVIREIDSKINTENAGADVANKIKELGIASK